MANTCKHIDCLTIVADPKEDYCRQHRLETSQEETLEDTLGLLDVSDEPRVVQERLRRMAGISQPYFEHGYLPFPSPDGLVGTWTIQAHPLLLFKPMALMMWGYDDTTVITSAHIGHQIQGAASFGELPASFFGTAKTYEKLVEDLARNGISPPNWITWSTCMVGNIVSIQGVGPLKHAVMLGKMAF